MPAPILAAKKVFIANAPGENLPASLGGPDRTYNEFYAAMKSWGRYELVAAPADADLIFEISFSSSLAGVGGTSTMGCSSSTDNTVRLVILDPKVRVPVWWFTEQVKQETFRGLRPEALNRSLVRAIATLVDDTKKLAGQTGVAPTDAQK
ncbi:MAG: hypothetical protein ACHP7J_06980 [Terriglobales bacterium]